jgi:hypothetical protein
LYVGIQEESGISKGIFLFRFATEGGAVAWRSVSP